ncbi:hypothetical protein DYBT9275_04438 [Dyadobacter sp. CECT 9275]|uniref:DUF4249 domain-containing protein n=1 Tax=Dyadobacter helix TaxID=2822344 RepID=A0A916JFT3_9BACT|nr:DUF4249 domain-containing protein [Dyadobacter sp. CECT 9275]CAG5009172.1 hypothetical protein DYBT9275_04438 [Dyadobacter sp. CECT 9275]
MVIQNIFKSLVYSLVLLSTLMSLMSCEDVIDLKTANGPSQMVVDGWITNQPGAQTIRLTWSADYFDNGAAKPVLNAEVTVTDNLGNKYEFPYSGADGKYVWNGADTLGHIGRTYTLSIKNGDDTYTAFNQIKRVPTVDSVVYQHETYPFEPDKGPKKGFIAEFYARDFVGEGDTYWIKPVVSGKVSANNPVNISIAYDAAFGSGAPSDGLIFILPLRQSITVDSLYSAGNSVGVELHSITNEAFEFLKLVREQASNGGLFATPNSNIKSNVVNTNANGPKALGYFGASAVSRKETVIDPAKARPEED